MKTKSTGILVLLGDGSYRGYWVGTTVTVPFEVEDVSFDVYECVVGEADVMIEVQNGIATIETV